MVQAGEEFVCTSCGVIAKSETPPIVAATTNRPGNGDKHLGSYIGTKEDEDSHAPFNGNTTVGYAKKVSDHMGEDAAAWNCSAMIGRVAEKLSLPAFVRENAVLLSGRLLAETRRDGEAKRRSRATTPAISAYAILAACRDAGIAHVSAKSILQTFTDMGHRVSKSKLLRLGMESQVPIKPADPEALLQTVVGRLESNEAVAYRLRRDGIERLQFFRQLLQASQTIVGEVRARMPGSSPRTVAASAVYMAAREIGPRVVTQKEAAETMGVAEYTIREFSGWATREFSRPLKAGGA